MTDADAAAKLADCLAFGGKAWPDDTAMRLRDLTGRVEHLATARELTALLVPAA
jgi:hypothetical protein